MMLRPPPLLSTVVRSAGDGKERVVSKLQLSENTAA